MRKERWIRKILILSMLATGYVVNADPLLPNGNFELDANSDKWPDSWSKAAHLSWHSENGKHFLRIKSTEPGKMQTLYKVINLPKNVKALEFSITGKCSNLKIGKKKWYDARVILNFKDAEGKRKGKSSVVSFKGNSKNWIMKKVELSVPEGAVKLEVMPCLFKVESGIFDIEALNLTIIPLETILKRKKKAAIKKKEKMKQLANAKCWILTDKGENASTKMLNFWQNDFTGLEIPCTVASDISAFDEKTDISHVKYMIVNLSRITEGFARNIEKWVKNGGVAIIERTPTQYIPPQSSGLEKYSRKIKPFINIGDTKRTKVPQGLIRVVSAVAYNKGELIALKGPEKSILYKFMAERKYLAPRKKKKISYLYFISGKPDGNFCKKMLLLNAEIELERGKNEVKPVLIRHRYGKGYGYYTTLELSSSSDFSKILRQGLIKQIITDLAIPYVKSQTIYHTMTGATVSNENKKKPSVPDRPKPPPNCLLELQGDQFIPNAGSPSWAPWRIALSRPSSPITIDFDLESPNIPLWMEVKAAYGDHTDIPVIDVFLNGNLLMKRKAPWARIQYAAKYYDKMYPVSFYIPKKIIKKKNKLTFVNHGPDWFVLDYVRFFPATGDEALASIKKKDNPGKYECKTIVADFKLDGQLDDQMWSKAFWKEFVSDGGKHTKNQTSKFAFAADSQNLYIGINTWHDNTVIEFAVAFPGCKQSYLFCFDDKGVAFARNYDDEIIPKIPLKCISKFDKSGALSIEAQIPLDCLPSDFKDMYYREQLRAVIPVGGRVSLNVFRRSRIGKTACVWQSFLPFSYHGEKAFNMSRTYMTRVPYHFMYKNVENGVLYNIPYTHNPLIWDGLHWGANTVILENANAKFISAKIIIRRVGSERIVYEKQLLSGKNVLKFNIDLPGHNEISIELYDAEGVLALLDMRPVEIEKPFSMKLNRSYYTDEKMASLFVKFNYPDNFKQYVGQLNVELFLPDGKIDVISKQVTSPTIKFDFKIGDLKTGSYEMVISTNINGHKYIVNGPEIIKRPPSDMEIKLRNDGFMLVNNKPLFPMGLLIDKPNVNPDFTFIRDGGLNTALVWRNINSDNFKKLADSKLYAIISTTGSHNGGGSWMVDYKKAEKMIDMAKKSPALLGYYPIDEPEYWHAPNCTPKQLRRFNEFTRKQDPYRPNMISHGVGDIHYGISEGLPFNDVVDIRIWEAYGDPAGIVKRMDEMKTVGRNDKAESWAFLKLGPGWTCSSVDPIQFRANVFAAFVSGCRGILFFMGSTARWTGKDLWPEVSKRVSSEIQNMADSRMKESSVPLKIASDNNYIRVMSWQDEKDVWIVAVNINKGPQKATITIEGNFKFFGVHKPVFIEMPVIKSIGHSFELDFQRYEVGCWQLTTQ